MYNFLSKINNINKIDTVNYMIKYNCAISQIGREEQGCFCDPNIYIPLIVNQTSLKTVIMCPNCWKQLYKPENFVIYKK